MGPGSCRHHPDGGGSWSTGSEVGTGEVFSSSRRRRFAVYRESGRDRGGVILRAAEARGQPGVRVRPGRCHPPGGGVSRSTGREGETGEVSSSGRRRLAVHREGGCDRGGVVHREAEARGLPGERVGPGRRQPPGGGGTLSTGREGGTREVSSSSGRRRLVVHRESGWDRGGVVIFQEEEARGLPGERVGPGRYDRGGVILRAAEARGTPGGRVRPGRCHPPGGGGSRTTRREGATGEVSSSYRLRRLAVHREGVCDRGGRHPPGGGGSRSTMREGATGEVSSSSRRRRLAVYLERGWDRGGVILRAAEARGPPGVRVGPGRCHPPGGGGSRSTGREGGTGEVSSSGRRRLAVHR